MIVLTDFSTALDRTPSARSSLSALARNATSSAVSGFIATRCGLKIDTSEQHEGFDLYRVVDELGKLSPFAVICTGDDQVSDPQRTGIAIDHAIRELGFYDRSNVVIHSSPFDRLRPHLQFSDVSYVFLSSSQIISILVPEQKSGVRNDIKPRDLLLQQILAATPLRLLNPYVFRGPIDDRLFVGRTNDIAILTKLDASYALVGPRSIGKSSLANKVVRQLRASGACVLKVEFGGSLSEYALIKKLIGQLVEDYKAWPRFLDRVAVSTFEHLVEWAYHEYGKVSLFIDEADELAQRCPDLAASLRRLHDDDFLRFVLIGYKYLRRNLSDASGPLFNVVQRLDLSSISQKECGALILRPVAELGVTFENLERIVEILHTSSGGAPSRIQLFCYALINNLDGQPSRQLTVEQSTKAVHMPEVRDEIVNWFRSSTTELERVLVGCMTVVGPLPAPTAQVIKEVSQEFAISPDRIEAEIQDLIIADVLRETGESLHFTFPQMEQMVRPTGDVRSAMAAYRRFFRDKRVGGGQ